LLDGYFVLDGYYGYLAVDGYLVLDGYYGYLAVEGYYGYLVLVVTWLSMDTLCWWLLGAG
jgi:hypothetical protein